MKITVPHIRDVVMLALGTAGMVNELFVRPAPRELAVYVSMGLLLGPALILAMWQAWNARGQARVPSSAPGVEPSPSSGSSSPSPP